MWIALFLFLFVIFLGYAWYTQYGNTDPTASVPKRVMAAMGLAIAALTAAISAWFNSGAAP